MADVRQRPTRRQLETLIAYIEVGSIAPAAHELGIQRNHSAAAPVQALPSDGLPERRTSRLSTRSSGVCKRGSLPDTWVVGLPPDGVTPSQRWWPALQSVGRPLVEVEPQRGLDIPGRELVQGAASEWLKQDPILLGRLEPRCLPVAPSRLERRRHSLVLGDDQEFRLGTRHGVANDAEPQRLYAVARILAAAIQPVSQGPGNRRGQLCRQRRSTTPTGQPGGQPCVLADLHEARAGLATHEPALLDRQLDSEVGHPRTRRQPAGSQQHEMTEVAALQLAQSTGDEQKDGWWSRVWSRRRSSESAGVARCVRPATVSERL